VSDGSFHLFKLTPKAACICLSAESYRRSTCTWAEVRQIELTHLLVCVLCLLQSKADGAGSSTKDQFQKQKQEVVGESKENIKAAEKTLQVSKSLSPGVLWQMAKLANCHQLENQFFSPGGKHCTLFQLVNGDGCMAD